MQVVFHCTTKNTQHQPTLLRKKKLITDLWHIIYYTRKINPTPQTAISQPRKIISLIREYNVCALRTRAHTYMYIRNKRAPIKNPSNTFHGLEKTPEIENTPAAQRKKQSSKSS